MQLIHSIEKFCAIFRAGLRLDRIIFVTLIGLYFFCDASFAETDPLKTIYVIADTDNSLTQKTITDLQLQLANARFVWKLFDTKKLQAQLFSTIASDRSLILTIGSPAARAILDFDVRSPILQILVTRAVADYVKDNIKPELRDNVHAIYLDQPPSRIFRFARAIFRDTEGIAMLVGKGGRRYLNELTRGATENHIGLTRLEYDEGNASRSLQELINQHLPILVVPDADVNTPVNTKWLLYMAYQERIPVLGYSSSFVEAGAVAAIFSLPPHVVQQAAELLVDWNKNGSSALKGGFFPKYFEFRFNQNVATGLRLELPDVTELKRLLQSSEGM